MKVSEAFLVNTKNFDPIIETLVNYDADEVVVNSELLERLSYSDPNDLLVIRILKDFSILDNDGRPAKYFEEFQNPETTKKALAKGLLSAYEGIFDKHPHIHQQTQQKIKESFEEHFKDKKTDLIIKYISGTFEKIVSYVGTSTIDALLNDNSSDENLTEAVAEAAEHSMTGNGSTVNSGKDNHDVQREEKSDNSIDDFLSSFEASGTKSDFSASQDDQYEDTGDNNPTEDPSVQEFVNDIEESNKNESIDEPEETKEQQRKSKPEEPDDTLEEIEDHDTDNEEPRDEIDDVFNFEIATPPEQKSATSELDQKNDKADINPIDLELPMSKATNTTTTMKNVTAEHKFVQKALLRKSDLLHKMKRWEELVPTLEKIIDRYDNQEHIDFKDVVERSIIRRAIALLKLGKNDKALPALNTVISRFKDSNNREFYEQASRAMLYKVNILEKQDVTSDELLPLYNNIIDRLDANSELLLKEKLDEIHCKRFDLIIGENNPAMLLEASTKLVNRFKDSENHSEYLQKAMIIRAETLDEMGEDEAALQAYDAFLKRFGN